VPATASVAADYAVVRDPQIEKLSGKKPENDQSWYGSLCVLSGHRKDGRLDSRIFSRVYLRLLDTVVQQCLIKWIIKYLGPDKSRSNAQTAMKLPVFGKEKVNKLSV
jgi:hypothetical protein